MRLIDADALEELFREVIRGIAKKSEMNGNLEHMVRASAMVIEMIKDASTIKERKTGQWIERQVTDEKCIDVWQSARCSVCGKYHTTPYAYYFDNYNFCPNCGAKMDGGK